MKKIKSIRLTSFKNMKNLVIIFICLSSFTALNAKETNNFIGNTQAAELSLWHDLITPDLDASKSFYGDLFGWTFTDTNMKGLRYATIYNDGNVIGGMIEVKEVNTATWISALPLDNANLNARIKSVVASGAKAALAPIKLPGRGKQVVFQGSLGERFSLISKNDYTEKMDRSSKEGNWIGMELWADDPAQASVFYNNAFAVSTNKTSYDDKPYWTFEFEGQAVAGMLQNPITNQGSQWVPYIQSSNINEMLPAMEASEADILLSPNEDIRDGKLGIFVDPQGAIFAVQEL
jgi:hypothetical protein